MLDPKRIRTDKNYVIKNLARRGVKVNLDEIIHRLQEQKTINLLQIQRLKKRKLILKDRIANLKDRIEPDIIA